MTATLRISACATALVLVLLVIFSPRAFTDEDEASKAKVFRAGAAAVDITPPNFPVRVNGMFTERAADRAVDPLYARALALDDGASQLVLCVVDTCMMPRELIDEAKELVRRKSGLAVDRIMVSATHTHSAPSAMGCLGSRMDPGYVAWLPEKLAEAMLAALENLQPARVGWASVDDWEHTHNRRWILRADRTGNDPFGNRTMRANMHPGHQSANVIGPSGPVDPQLSVLAVQKRDGTPLGLLANYSQHYFGSPLLSADYFGAFSRHVAKQLGQTSGAGPFVAMMSQGTSGDLMWMDYGAPNKPVSLDAYSQAMANSALAAYKSITWHDHVPLGVAEKKLSLRYRVPDADRLAWAQARVAALGDDLPRAQADIYAKEAVVLHEKQKAELVLQAIRVGDLSIAALPNEVYAITGLKLKAQSPFAAHMNIALANGAEGYIPPKEQHQLGGYTSWPARTAGLEVEAEPQIIEALLGSLEELAGRDRRPLADEQGPYAKAIVAAGPLAYWRLDDIAGNLARNAVPDGPPAHIEGKAALYLPGVASGSGCGAEEALRPSNFSGPAQINRAMHFVADGHLQADLTRKLGDQFSIALWCWLGERSGASERDGTLVKLPSGDALSCRQGADHMAALSFGTVGNAEIGSAKLPADDWHFVVLVRDADKIRVFVDGAAEPDLVTTTTASQPAASGTLQFADGLEGKLDEIAVFDRALDAAEITSHWRASGIAQQRARQKAERERAAQEAAERAKPPTFPASYRASIDAMKPTIHATLDAAPKDLTAERGVRFSPATYAAFASGRIRGEQKSLGPAYSVSLWFKNDLANHARPVTAYLFSRGPDGDPLAPGDHLGIGGTHQPQFTGKLIVFNGNAEDDVVAGATAIPAGTWNHVVFVRDANRARVYLNGSAKPEIDAALKPTTGGSAELFIGARSDHFAPLSGYLAEFALFDRAISAEEARQLHAASGQPH